MYRWLSGNVIDKDFDGLVIETGGVGYKVNVSGDVLANCFLSKSLELWIHTAVRENSIELYGFIKKDDLEFFELLLTVSGIGPKSAITIMKAANAETLREGISSGDAGYLSKISGIGKKTAEKIVLGLKDKVGALSDNHSSGEGSVAIEALTSLGYSEKEAREAIQKVKNKTNSQEMIKEALRNIQK